MRFVQSLALVVGLLIACVSAQTVPPLDAGATPLTAQNIAGHRLWMILFDRNGMSIEDVRRSTDDAAAWVRGKTPNVDVVAVAVIGPNGVSVTQDFTTTDAKIQAAIRTFPDSPAEAGAARAGSEFDTLINDVRLTGLKTVCDAMQAWPDKKEILYFTTGLARDGNDSSLYRDTISSCEKAHVTIDTIDARGLVVGAGRAGSTSARGAGGRSASAGAGGRAAGGAPRAVTPLQEVPTPGKPDFSGDWQLINTPDSLTQSPLALWLGRAPSLSVSTMKPATLTIRVGGSGAAPWMFTLDGSRTVNHTALPGEWQSTASWKSDTLVLTMSGVVSKDGRLTPVSSEQALALVDVDGVVKAGLRVTTTSTPAGILSDGVSFYRRR